MVEIRRIEEPDAAEVVGLWNQMCADTPDGGPLGARGRLNLQRMLEILAWHRDAFCLVAVEPSAVHGFVCARVDSGTGLLPGVVGLVEESYVRPDTPDPGGLRRQLVEAAVAALRDRGAGTVRHLIDAEDGEAHALFVALGFKADMTCLSLYEGG